MRILLEDLVDCSFVINVDEQRLRFFYEQWRAAGLPSHLRRFIGLRMAQNKLMHGYGITRYNKAFMSIMQTHAMAVSMANAMRLPFICVFEDDAVGKRDVEKHMRERLSDIPDDTDILILGNTKTFGVKRDLGNGLVAPTKSYGLQSYVVMRKAYEKFIEYFSLTRCSNGLTGAAENVYLVKDILFCQYSQFPDKNITCHKKGFWHWSFP